MTLSDILFYLMKNQRLRICHTVQLDQKSCKYIFTGMLSPCRFKISPFEPTIFNIIESPGFLEATIFPKIDFLRWRQDFDATANFGVFIRFKN
jgi:hypothetical protein